MIMKNSSPGRFILSFILIAAVSFMPGQVLAEEIVVLLHGIANVPISMKYLEDNLEEAGYRVYNLGYPSTGETIEKAAALVREKVLAIKGADRINFVGHSMGNLVIRKMLGKSLPGLGRIVMIAPPNQGSLVAEQLENLDLYKWIFGPAGQELPADNRAFFEKLPIPDCEFGIIAGGRGTDEGYNPLLPGDDDGTVAVEETKLKGAADFIVINRTHTLILFAPETVKQTIHFLKNGRFKRPGSD
jgi:pimeloyl-ACP methyl ester carboxylesterase